MGDGGGQFVVSRDQHDPDGPLLRRRITRTYRRTAYHLQVLTLRDEAGIEQTIRVTDEHPFHVAGTGWTPARLLEEGDRLLGADGTLTVVANAGEAHSQGVAVYNLEVEQAHTYFVLAEDAGEAAAVWVHNATNYESVEGGIRKYVGIADTGANPSLLRRLKAARARTPAASTVEILGASGHTPLEVQQIEQALIHYHGRAGIEAGGTLVNKYRGTNLSQANVDAGYALLKKMGYWDRRQFMVHMNGSGI